MGPAPRNLTVAALGHGDHGVAKVAQCGGGLFLGGVSRPWLLIENVKDFRPILLRALHADTSTAGILYTSNRAFPRSRKNPGPLIQAIHFWMLNGPPEPPLTEDWLLSTEGRQPTLAAG